MFIDENVPKLNHIRNNEVTSFHISMMTSVFSERENTGLIICKRTTVLTRNKYFDHTPWSPDISKIVFLPSHHTVKNDNFFRVSVPFRERLETFCRGVQKTPI